MKSLRIVFLILLASPAWARRMNFIEAHQLRLSSQQNALHWLNPFQQTRNPQTFESNVYFSEQKDVYSLYKDVQSKDQTKITNRLQDSFGHPYDASAKVNFGYRNGALSQFFSTNAGAVLVATDPVFPELKGFLFHDYVSSTGYLFKPTKNWVIKPQLNLGVRRTLDKSYTTGDLVSSKLDVKFNKTPYIGFMELNLMSIYSFASWGQALAEINSLPLIKNDYQYWDTFLGYRSPIFWETTYVYGGYAPLYAGKYDVARTQKWGARFGKNFFSLDVFTMDKYYPGAIMGFMFKFVEVSLVTFERAYDDFGKQKSRQYDFNLKMSW
jgi:hypothetical protein